MKHPKPPADPDGYTRTPARQFRLGDDTLALLDAIAARYQTPSRAQAIRIAVTELAERLGITVPTAPPTALPTGARAEAGDVAKKQLRRKPKKNPKK